MSSPSYPDSNDVPVLTPSYALCSSSGVVQDDCDIAEWTTSSNVLTQTTSQFETEKWAQTEDPDGRVFYRNKSTGKGSWELPQNDSFDDSWLSPGLVSKQAFESFYSRFNDVNSPLEPLHSAAAALEAGKPLPPRPSSSRTSSTCCGIESTSLYKDIKKEKQNRGLLKLGDEPGPDNVYKDIRQKKALKKENAGLTEQPPSVLAGEEILLDQLAQYLAVEIRSGDQNIEDAADKTLESKDDPADSEFDEETLDFILGHTDAVDQLDKEESHLFIQGKVTLGIADAMRMMLESSLPNGTHGCLVSKSLTCINGQYGENLGYIPLWSLKTDNEFTSRDLCLDATSRVRTVRIRMEKTFFRQNAALIPMILKHQNLEDFYGLIQHDFRLVPHIDRFVEYAGIALDDYMKTVSLTYTELDNRVQQIVYDIASGLEFLHRHQIIHLDVKQDGPYFQSRDPRRQHFRSHYPRWRLFGYGMMTVLPVKVVTSDQHTAQNMYIKEENGSCLTKLSNFGLAKLQQDPLPPTDCPFWTPEYMSPEICLYHLRGCEIWSIEDRTDVFSLGVLTASLYLKTDLGVNIITDGQYSYAGYSDTDIKQMQNNLIRWIAASSALVRNAVPDTIQQHMRSLINSMLEHSVSDRPTCPEVKMHINSRMMCYKRKTDEFDEILTKRPRTEGVNEDIQKRLRAKLGQGSCFNPVTKLPGSEHSSYDSASSSSYGQQQISADCRTAASLHLSATVEPVMDSPIFQPAGNLPDLQAIQSAKRPAPKPRKKKRKQ